jgi:multidrug efflux pump subunit AcrB
MHRHIVAFAVAVLFCGSCATADQVALTVQASYPGASAQTVSDTVAAPIEQQINGVESMTRIESESRSDGSYVARVFFKRGADPNVAVTLVKNRVALAQPVLPDVVQRAGVEVKIGSASMDRQQVQIALIDQGQLGWQAMHDLAAAVIKRLAGDNALVKPEAFPALDEKHIDVQIDRVKCHEFGIEMAAVFDALKVLRTPGTTIESMKKLTVATIKGKAIPLAEIATFERVSGPNAVYRLNLYDAVRITGTATQGMSTESAAAKCTEIAETVRRSQKSADGFKVENLTAR